MEPKGQRRSAALTGEMLFVLGAVLLLKEWVFPWLIWQWFPMGDDAARMLEWMVIMVAVVTCFSYIGFGSVSAHFHGTSGKEAAAVWLLIHLPLIAAAFSPLHSAPLLGEISHAWNGLIGDGLRLFAPKLPLESVIVPLMTLFFFWLGRGIRVSEEPEEKIREIQGRAAS
ncbi:hypothetical protein [Desmospora profundinema]|uniref:Uncharacterized protein n=1 Tax=Desmospora profundinema TaxID=1571184 RepID=A0ABU1IKI9_9BACL|nr:hypothetical protein [Desmospora profundinema]MDR6224489.1 hypothetical protein [Desmospora profundinema]